jgi:PAS domain S-box-containing protein
VPKAIKAGRNGPVLGVGESTILRAIYEHAEVGLELVAPDGRLLSVNPALCRMLGYKEGELLQKTFRDITHPDDLAAEKPALEELFAGKRSSYESEKRFLHRNGSPVWVTVTSSAVKDVAGAVLYRVSVVQNVTERKQAEAALRKSEEKFAKAFRCGPMALVLATASENRLLDVNQTFERLSGYKRDQVIGHTSLELGLWENPEDLRQLTQRLFTQGGSLQDAECKFRIRDGSIRSSLVSAEAMDLNGETCILSVIADVTDRKRAEAALRESKDELHLLLESTAEAIYGMDLKGRCTFCNPACLKTLGYERPEELLGKDMHRLIHHARSDGTPLPVEECWIYRAIRAGEGVHVEGEVLWRADGTSFPAEYWSHPQRKGQELVGAVVTFLDITERKRSEQAVRESEERFRLVANTAPVLIWMSGPDKLCTYFNQPWLDFTGRSLGSQIGNGWADLVHPDDRERCWDTYSQAFDRGQPFSMEYRLLRHDGQFRWVLDDGVPRISPDGSFAGYIGSCVDVTERRAAEEVLRKVSGRLIEAQERERSRIARELHDDITQRLAVLAIGIEELRKNSGGPGDQIESLYNATLDISSTVQALSHRLHSSKLEYLGLVAAIKSFCSEFAQQHNVDVDFSHGTIPASLPYDVSLCLFRVLQEALRNAVKHSGARRFRARLQWADGKLQLTVSDSGVGFDTRAAMKSPGLGLISMRERVNLVKGTLSIISGPKQGTEITVRVPVAEAIGKRSAKMSA